MSLMPSLKNRVRALERAAFIAAGGIVLRHAGDRTEVRARIERLQDRGARLVYVANLARIPKEP